VNRNGAYDEWIHGGSDPDGRVSISPKKVGDSDSFPQDLSGMAGCLRTLAGDSVARKAANGALWLRCRSQGCLVQLDWRLGAQKRGWNVYGVHCLVGQLCCAVSFFFWSLERPGANLLGIFEDLCSRYHRGTVLCQYR